MEDITRIALEVIETLAGGDFAGSNFQPERITLNDIYKFAHTGLGDCSNSHDDWNRELRRAHRQMRKDKLI
jgi:hypothetical protein